jgi:pimeloyl-ACP methyl ester carboxylesterase
MAAPVKDKQIVVVPKAKHFVFLDDPGAFYTAISKFIARQDGAGDSSDDER